MRPQLSHGRDSISPPKMGRTQVLLEMLHSHCKAKPGCNMAVGFATN